MLSVQAFKYANPYFSILRPRTSLEFDPGDFYGSMAAVRLILEEITAVAPHAIELQGLPGMGKSTLLHYLAHPQGGICKTDYMQPPFDSQPYRLLMVLVNFQNMPPDKKPLEYLWEGFRRALRRYDRMIELTDPTATSSAGEPVPLELDETKDPSLDNLVRFGPDLPEDFTASELLKSIRNIYRSAQGKASAKDKLDYCFQRLTDQMVRPVLLLDNFHVGFERMDKNDAATLALWKRIVSFVLVTEKNLVRVNRSVYATKFFQLMQVIHIGPLDKDDAEKLIADPAASQKVELPPEDIDFVISQTGGHIQLLIIAGNLLWNLRQRLQQAMKLKPTEALSPAQKDVLDAQLYSAFMQPFTMYWLYLQPEERDALRVLAQLAKGEEFVQSHERKAFKKGKEFFLQFGIATTSKGYGSRQLLPFLALLEEKGLTRSNEDATSYEIFPPLFSSWVQEFSGKVKVEDETDGSSDMSLPSVAQLQLTGFESKLYEFLCANLERVCTFAELSLEVWGDPTLAENEQEARKKLQVLISRLRPKISPFKLDIVNIRDQGYRLVQDDGAPVEKS